MRRTVRRAIGIGTGVAAVVIAGLPHGLHADASAAAPAVAAIDAAAIPAGAGTIKLDGHLTDPAWATVAVASDFRQRQPDEGAAATHRTDVRVLFDGTALYVGVRAFDPEPDRVAGVLSRRDDSPPSDWVSILIDSFHDRRSAFEFGVNPAGVKYDQYWFSDTNNDRGWDAVWDAAVSRSDQGWEAEFRIPFSQLRFRAGQDNTLGFAVMRTINHLNETDTWPLLARSAPGFVSSFGELRGVRRSGAVKTLELMPYVLSQVATAPVEAGNPLARSPDSSASAGLDFKYKVGSGLTLTGTVNPDFGQVEADPAVVNLSGFETFFSERRPFFVEGSGNFTFDNLFYSRRIGRAPERSVDAPDGGYVASPANSTILGALKLTGRVGKFSIGALNAVTSAEQARVASGPALAISSTPVEPATSYSVARVTREFDNSSHVAVMLTSTNRSLRDELRFLPASAAVGAVDADWRLHHGRYSLSGSWEGSSVQGTPKAIDDLQRDNVHSFQRPDAGYLVEDPTRTALRGDSGSASFGKISGQHTLFNVNAGYRSPGFEVNDLGFESRADQIWQNSWLQIKSERPRKHVRESRINFNQWGGWNFGGDQREFGVNINTHWVFTNNWSLGTGVNVNREAFDDRLTRGGPGGLMPGNVNQWWYVNGDPRRRVSLNLSGAWLVDPHGSHDVNQEVGLTIRPSSALYLNLDVNADQGVRDTQWIENVDDDVRTHYLFGRIDQTTVGVSVRLTYTIRPSLTIQLYGQPFVSAGAYSRFKELVNGRAAAYADRFAPAVYTSNPDFNFQSFRTTNVLRWEYRPGSALFVVWQQGRQTTLGYGDFRFGRDFGRTFSTPSENVFLVKFSRWLNF
jgi:hypothetical protein